jgi:hypothetical protein
VKLHLFASASVLVVTVGPSAGSSSSDGFDNSPGGNTTVDVSLMGDSVPAEFQKARTPPGRLGRDRHRTAARLHGDDLA